MILILLVFLHRIDKRLGHFQFRHLTIIKGKGDSTVIQGINNKVGGYLLHVPAYRLT